MSVYWDRKECVETLYVLSRSRLFQWVAGLIFMSVSYQALASEFPDTDGDGVDDQSEIRSGTDPDDADSFFAATNYVVGATDRLIYWPGVTNRRYQVEYGIDNTGYSDSFVFSTTSSWFTGADGGMSYTDVVSITGNTAWFHQVISQEIDADDDGMADWWEIEEFGSVTNVDKIKGMRVDFSFVFNPPFEGLTAGQRAQLIVDTAVDYGMNYLYVMPLHPVNGTWWNTNNNVFSTQYLAHQQDLGKDNIFGELLDRAHLEDIKVIAWMQPPNAYKAAWDANLSWRYKKKDGLDFRPSAYWLTPFNTNVIHWMTNLVSELIDLGVDGIDVSETDYGKFSLNENTNATYDAAASNSYFSAFPSGQFGDDDWYRHREEILATNLYGAIGKTVRDRGKEFHFTYVWNTGSNLSNTNDLISADLWAPDVLFKNTGFNLDLILDLPADRRPHFFVPQLRWESQAAAHNDTNRFTPAWTVDASTTVVAYVDGRAATSVHVELSPGSTNANGTPIPTVFQTLEQIEESVKAAFQHSAGTDFYDLWQTLTTVYTNSGSVVTGAEIAVKAVFTNDLLSNEVVQRKIYSENILGASQVTIPPSNEFNLVAYNFTGIAGKDITLSHIFGLDQLNKGGFPTLADNVSLWNEETQDYSIYFQKTDNLFYDGGNPFGASTNPVLVAGTPLWLNSPSAETNLRDVVLVGEVEFSVQTDQDLVEGLNHLNLPYSSSLIVTNNDWLAEGAVGGSFPTTSGLISVWNGTGYDQYFITTSGGWKSADDPFGPDVSPVIPLTAGAWYDAKTNFTTTLDRPYDNK